MQHHFYIPPNNAYFFDDIDRIAADDYVPTYEDYLREDHVGSGIYPRQFSMKFEELAYNGKYETQEWLADFIEFAGSRNQRGKWRHMMDVEDRPRIIMYMMSIGSYNCKCYGGNNNLRLREALDCFEQLAVNSKSTGRYLTGCKLIVLFTHYDLFLKKIEKIPITVEMNDYPGDKDPCDEDDVIEFVEGKLIESLKRNNVEINGDITMMKINNLDTEDLKQKLNDIYLEVVDAHLTENGY